MKKYVIVGIGIVIASLSIINTYAVEASADNRSPVAEQHIPVCARGTASEVGCHARVVVDAKGSPQVLPAPSGLGPTAFHAAYGVPTTTASKQIIAIVDAVKTNVNIGDINRVRSSRRFSGNNRNKLTQIKDILVVRNQLQHNNNNNNNALNDKKQMVNNTTNLLHSVK